MRTAVQNIQENMPVNERFVLFSGHDGTLLALMAALEWLDKSQYNLHIPRYASSLIFELFEENSAFFVDVLYDDQIVAGMKHFPFDQFLEYSFSF